MALDLKPLIWNWSPVASGDTYPAARITETLSTEDLDRVTITIRASGSTSTAMLLDSNASGITIATSTAGGWDFTIDAIPTSGLAAGVYSYQLETTTTLGTVRTEFSGTWEILTY